MTVELNDEQLNSLTTKRLLALLKSVRKHRDCLHCDCGCGEIVGDLDKRSFARLQAYFDRIKKILNNREHVVRKEKKK